MSGESIRELFDAATTEVPGRYRTAPLTDIEGRVRRRRARLAVAAVAGTVALLLAGFGAAHAVVSGSGPLHPAAPLPSPSTSPSMSPTTSRSPVPPDKSALPWSVALVARDDQNIVVYSGTTRCHELSGPTARVTVQDAQQVVIAVHGQVLDGADCSSSGWAVGVMVSLPAALGSRTLYDAAGTNVAVYHERDLPDLEATGWRPFGTLWPTGDHTWRQGYNGPGGSEIDLTAGPSGTDDGSGHITHNGTVPGPTVKLGTRQGTLVDLKQGQWRVDWQVDGVPFSLEYVPSEGGGFSQDQFTELLAALHWS